MATRSPEEIRVSIESNRAELARSVQQLRGEVAKLTDWRAQLQRHRTPVLVGAAVVGFAIGAALVRRRRG